MRFATSPEMPMLGVGAGSAVAKEISSPDDNGRLLIFGPVKRGTMCRRGRRWLR
jgi:hypothetical protein